MQDWVNLISNVGFPVFIAVYVLARLEPTIRNLEKTISVLTIILAKSTGVSLEDAKILAGRRDL